MKLRLFSAALLALSANSAVALPSLEARDATKLSAEQLASYSPFTQFARAAYCPSTKIIPWECGGTSYSSWQLTSIRLRLMRTSTEACAANADFRPSLIGGDGNAIQLCRSTLGKPRNFHYLLTARCFFPDFVGYWPAQNAVVVAHQGTDPKEL